VTGRGQADIGSLLEGVLANLDLRTRFREHLAVMAWPQVAGETVAAHSQAEAVRDGVLIVAADSPAWAHELQMRQQELLRLLAARVGEGVIREVHFRSGLRRRGQKFSSPRGRAGRPAELKLSGRQERQISEAAAKIEDEDLRERAERALASLARMAEWRKRNGWRRCRRCGQWQRVGRRWCSSCSHSGGRRRRR
jgi:predicted nucleic acid-binding Zn ribbon protein